MDTRNCLPNFKQMFLDYRRLIVSGKELQVSKALTMLRRVSGRKGSGNKIVFFIMNKMWAGSNTQNKFDL